MEFIFMHLLHVVYIIEGYVKWWWNTITGKTAAKAKERLKICGKCECNEKGICNECGCIINAKVRCDYIEDDDGISIDGCPLKKW